MLSKIVNSTKSAQRVCLDLARSRRSSHSHQLDPHSGRTSITSRLWEHRASGKGAHKADATHSAIKTEASDATNFDKPSFLLDKKPSDSLVEILMPFATDHTLREQYINTVGNIRFGKILEDLDACAGNIAHIHADDNNPATRPLTIVTASVDRIDLLSKLHIDRDMRMRGCVSHVGNSSMEVRIDVESLNPQTNQFDPLVLAHFTMVALWEGRPTPVNRLAPQNEHEKTLFQLGEQNKLQRKEFARKSLAVKPPDAEEVQALHDLYLEANKAKKDPSLPLPKHVVISSTHIQTTVLCHPQERNTAGKIFGGYLMRTAHELAWACANVFFQNRPWFLALDDVHFYRPVEIGSILQFDAEVIYTEGHAVVIRVLASVLDASTGLRHATNSFHFTFTCPECKEIKSVLPYSYEESLRWVDGKRRFNFSKEFAGSMQSRLLRFY